MRDKSHFTEYSTCQRSYIWMLIYEMVYPSSIFSNTELFLLPYRFPLDFRATLAASIQRLFYLTPQSFPFPTPSPALSQTDFPVYNLELSFALYLPTVNEYSCYYIYIARPLSWDFIFDVSFNFH